MRTNAPSPGKAIRSLTFGLAVALLAVPAFGATVTFFDDFNRPDGPVGNGWSEMVPIDAPSPSIVSGKLTSLEPSALGVPELDGVYRPISLAGEVTVSATVTGVNDNTGNLGRFTYTFLIGGTDNDQTGYGLRFSRGSSCCNNSTVDLHLNGTPNLVVLASPFQFQSSITPTIIWHTDGSITGSVSEGSNVFNFAFGPMAVSLPGSNFLLTMILPDFRGSILTFPTVDNLTITTEVAEPVSVTLFGLACAALAALAGRRRRCRVG